MRFIFNSKWFIAGFLTAFCPCAFGAAPPTTLISYVPAVESLDAETDARLESAALDAYLYGAVDEETLEELGGEPELLVFTARADGMCPACDRARSGWEKEAKRYPITPVFCSMSPRPKIKGDVIAEKFEVDRFPTFVLVVRNEDGTADEIERWSGAGSFFDPVDRHIRRAFAEAGFQPRIPAPSDRPKPAPRPIPGLNPPKPVPKPAPKPGRGEPRRFGFTAEWDGLI